jgi:hypothetical protein
VCEPVTIADVLGRQDAATTLKACAQPYDRRHADHAARQALAAGKSGGKGAVANYG